MCTSNCICLGKRRSYFPLTDHLLCYCYPQQAYYHLYLFGHLQLTTREVTNELRRGSVMSHVLYRRTTLTGEEDSRVCEEVHVEETQADGGGGGKEGVKKTANEEAWKGVPV